MQILDTDLPSDAYRWNKAIRGAFKKGMVAYSAGEPITGCPYADKRKECGRLTWSRSFRFAWCDGWKWAKQRADQNVQPGGPSHET